jgi:hypothetical protein
MPEAPLGGVRHGRGNSLRFFFGVMLLSVIDYSGRSPPLPDSWSALEAQRTSILRQISALGDLRPGSISAVVRRCGKPTCHCAKPNDPGPDPQLRLTRTVNGKTVAGSFASPAAFHKAQAEVHEYQRWRRLCAELVAVSERICRLRPIFLPPGRRGPRSHPLVRLPGSSPPRGCRRRAACRL